MVVKEIVELHDDLQKKHFKRHPNEEGKPIKQQYFTSGSSKRHPTTINKKKTLVR
nr:MAG: hypothetical protein [Lokiarchaeota virus Ratatoskr Meg22_1012]